MNYFSKEIKVFTGFFTEIQFQIQKIACYINYNFEFKKSQQSMFLYFLNKVDD